MPQPELKRATGNWVVGDQFWDRQVELALFIERLNEGAHLLLTAPRRIGKTSLMKEASRVMADDFICLYVDLQKAETPADAIVDISIAAAEYKPAWNRIRDLFKNAIRETVETVKLRELSIVLRGALTAGSWREKGDEILQILSEQDRPVALFLDEVSILVNRVLRGPDFVITDQRKQEVDSLLSWIRAATIKHQGRIRFVVTGSIGLEPLVRQAGLSATLNTFTPFHLGPWSREVADGCLRALSHSYQIAIPQDALDVMLDRLGVYVPHHVQIYFDHVYQAARLSGHDSVSANFVAEVYMRSMLGTRGHVELSHMEERLKMVLGPKLDLLALDLLTEAAVVGKLRRETAQQLAEYHFQQDWPKPLRDVLDILEHDGYLGERDGVYSFPSALLKDWWEGRFRFAHVPMDKRR
ncbi:MAG: hypothetical protein U0R19_26150 [Bryobacteraceae bacterium]